jgi:hypothetical protein
VSSPNQRKKEDVIIALECSTRQGISNINISELKKYAVE